jgi:hypothetical protein
MDNNKKMTQISKDNCEHILTNIQNPKAPLLIEPEKMPLNEWI